MVFAHEEIAFLADKGVMAEKFQFGQFVNIKTLVERGIKLHRLVNTWRPDLIHVHFGSAPAFVSALVSVIASVPLVITYRGSDLNPSPSDGLWRSRLQRLFSQLAALRACRIICVSRQLKERLWWRYGRAVIIPTGIDLGHFQPIPRAEARRCLDWRDNEKVVIFNAGLTPAVKRLDLAEAAVSVIRQTIGDVRLVVLHGDVPHSLVPTYLNAADCLLLTSDYEGSPDIVKEALACGLPIVSVDVGDVVERLDGVYPSRIVARDPRAIGTAAAEIILLAERSNGREYISEISAAMVTNKILEVYREIT